jgi:hypothetical protein
MKQSPKTNFGSYMSATRFKVQENKVKLFKQRERRKEEENDLKEARLAKREEREEAREEGGGITATSLGAG